MQIISLPNGTRKTVQIVETATACGQYIKSQFSNVVYIVRGNSGNRPNALTIEFAGRLVGGA